MTPVRFVLASALIALGVAALVGSVEVGKHIAGIDANVARIDDDLATHVAAGGGTSVDGDGYGAALETERVNNLAYRNEQVVRLWALRIGGPALVATAVIWLGVGLLTGKPRRRKRSRRRRGRSRPRT